MADRGRAGLGAPRAWLRTLGGALSIGSLLGGLLGLTLGILRDTGAAEYVGTQLVAFLLLDLTETVSMVEVLYTVPAVIITWRYAQRARRSLRLHRALSRRLPPAPLTVRLRELIRADRYLCLTLLAELLAAVGVVAMLQRPTQAAEQWSPVAVASAGFFFGMEWVLGLKGEIVDHRERALTWLYEQQVRLAAEQPRG